MPEPVAKLVSSLKSFSREDWLFAIVFSTFLGLVLAPWFSSRLLPLMDYSQFLTFVRAVQDMGDPASPFHGTYTTGWSLAPLSAPIALTRALSFGDLETGGRLLLAGHAVALPIAALLLLRAVGANRWNVILVCALVFSRMVTWGFFGFITSLPIIFFILALAVEQFKAPTRVRGVVLTLLFALLALWHGLAVFVGGFFFGVLWLCWRAPSYRAKALALLPTLGAIVFLSVWTTKFTDVAATGKNATFWLTLESAFHTENFFNRVFMLWPRAEVYAKVGALLLALQQLVSGRRPQRAIGEGDEPQRPTTHWYVKRPLVLLSILSLGLYFALPYKLRGVEVVNYRMIWFAALFLVMSLELPRADSRLGLGLRMTVVGVMVLFSGTYLLEVNQRFRAFHEETIGASRLIDRLESRQTLIAPVKNFGTPAFPLSHPVREIQQYATARHGGLPTTSFAVHRGTFVRFVDRNPMPHLTIHNWHRHRGLSRFDYVLLRKPPPRTVQRRLTLVERDGEWVLYRVKKKGS